MIFAVEDHQQQRLSHWYPALISGGIAFALFVFVGQTPILRAIALMGIVIGVTLMMRRLGAAYAISGGLALAFSPAFWSQTGGTPTQNSTLIVLLMAVGGIAAILIFGLSRRLMVGVALGIATFVLLFLVLGETDRSLRITNLLTAWLLYTLVIALRQTNPRPDEPPARHLSTRHTTIMLLLLVLGVLNDPLVTLITPAVVLGLWLSHAKLPPWYWFIVGGITVFGINGIQDTYISTFWATQSARQMQINGVTVPFIVFDGWREPLRWIYLIALVTRQFTWVGVLVSIIGVARLSRWYPTLGVVLMVAFAGYATFGLVYFGGNIEILLLPMLFIQVVWMTYAVYTLSEWLQKSVNSTPLTRWLLPAAFSILPIFLFIRILTA